MKPNDLITFLNEVTNDNLVLMTVMKVFLVNMLEPFGSNASQKLAELKAQTLDVLKTTSATSEDSQDTERIRNFVAFRAEKFFQDIETALALGEKSSRPEKPN